MTDRNLGKLESVHGIAPAFLQRAAILIVISFAFFVLMTIAFTIRKNVGYLLLATAFLIVQLFTLFGWIVQKRTLFKLYENGFTYRKQVCQWNEIDAVSIKSESRINADAKSGYEIVKSNGEKIVLSEAIEGIENIVERIRAELIKSGKWKVENGKWKTKTTRRISTHF